MSYDGWSDGTLSSVWKSGMSENNVIQEPVSGAQIDWGDESCEVYFTVKYDGWRDELGDHAAWVYRQIIEHLGEWVTTPLAVIGGAEET